MGVREAPETSVMSNQCADWFVLDTSRFLGPN